MVKKLQKAAEEKLGGMAGKMTAMAGEVGQQANRHWDKLETIFEERTARALGKLGVPTARQLAALAAGLAALKGEPAPKPARPAGKAAPARAARPARKTAKAAPTEAPAKPAR